MSRVQGIRSRLASAALLAAATACGQAPDQGAGRTELVVHAAISVREPLLALERDWEHATMVEVVYNFGASGDLARQILAGARADLFLSAGETETGALAEAGLLEASSLRALLANQLVVVVPADGPAGHAAPFDVQQLAAPAVRLLSIGDPRFVPAGRYAKAWLQSQGAWESVAGRILPAVDSRAALAAVESGGAQAGIVFRTDARHSTKVRIVHAVPPEQGPRIVYPLAVVRGSQATTGFLEGPEARAAFEAAGFVFLPAQAR